MSFERVHALCFDTFGTVVDWRGTIIETGEGLGREAGIDVDWAGFVDDWKAAYRPAMDTVNEGRRPWTNVDRILAERLHELVPEYGMEALPAGATERLLEAWTRSRPWPDVLAGMNRLAGRFVLSTLSNGNFLWLARIAKNADLPFDAILTAENAKAYKPRSEVYRMAIELLGPDPAQVMLVACHNYDLAAARAHGMRTAFVPGKEFGPAQTVDQEPAEAWDVIASDFEDLARRLGC